MQSSLSNCFYFISCILLRAIALIFLVRGSDSLASNAGPSSSSMILGSSFSNNQTLQSSNGLFQFGFFSLPSGSSSRYLGIWYTNIEPLISVWVANREQAVSEKATFSLSIDGQFTLVDAGKDIWAIGGSGLNASTLTLMDSGNLVLEGSNSRKIWQSFEHPGNTWLPTMTIGKGQKIQSWLTPNDPSPGPYYLQMGSSRNFVSVFNDSPPYWDSGDWNGQLFSNMPEMTKTFIYNFTFNSSGFTWSLYPDVGASYNISRFVMETSGIMHQSSFDPTSQKWNEFWYEPTDQCDVTRLCGQNSICDNSDMEPNCRCPSPGFQATNEEEWAQQVFIQGCSRISTLDCMSLTQGSGSDGFIPLNQTTFDWNVAAFFSTHDQGQCQDMCLQYNCSCNGVYFEAISGNCSLFSEPLYNGRASSSAVGTFYLRVSAKDLISNKSHKSGRVEIIAGLAAAAAVAILSLATLTAFLAARRRKGAARRKATLEGGLRAFSYAELKAATKHFKEKLGSGGFGTVFKGVIVGNGGAGSVAVAVKKLQRLDEGEKQFRAEVRTIGTIQHTNLVRLVGFCSEGKHRLLVYELAQNGSLDQLLFSNDGRAATLSWQHRKNIALGTARAMAYLHESCQKRIIHCDIKPENILLDPSYGAKVADFGLAKLIGREFTRVLTTLRGTRGYLAPEWMAGLPITTKADVYSFGMTLLELISGRRNIHADRVITNTTRPDAISFFPLHVAQIIHQPSADLTCIVDDRLIQGDISVKEVQKMTYCAIWCIQDNEDLRPSMGKVVQILEGSLSISPPPIPISLQCLVESESFYTNPLSKYSS